MALFGRKTEKRQQNSICVLLDSNSRMVARGTFTVAAGGQEVSVRLLEGDAEALSVIGIVQAVPQDKNLAPLMTRVLRCRDGVVTLAPMREAGAAMRRNFRMPVAFDSFLYPRRGGRATLRSVDLSCGGIAFRSRFPLTVGEEFEVVVPITADGPLVLQAQLLRVHLEPDGNFYACKFVNMIDDEETMLREAVFAIQISARRARAC